MSFHLRPVSDPSPSPSSSSASTTAPDRSPQPKSHPSRRPLSPSSLRDLNLSQDANPLPRKYPAPPTGHELMALFPPAPPASFPEMRPGPTSGFFQRQERAFFAQAGKEIVRVRVEVDVPVDEATREAGPQTWHPSSPAGYQKSRPSRAIPGPTYPGSPHGQPPQLPLNLHTPALRTPPHEPPKGEFQAEEDTDEAWRRPTPYTDRRRAGKHTRRVIVRT